MLLFSHAHAEMAELDAALEGLTTGEAAVGGTAFGIALGMLMSVAIVWYIFQAIADWMIFAKAGQGGWKSLIPIYNVVVEYGICWNGAVGFFTCVAVFCANFLTTGQNIENWKLIVAGVLVLIVLVLHIIQSIKLSRAFGMGVGFGICLILFGPIARVVLGFGSARYVGNPDR